MEGVETTHKIQDQLQPVWRHGIQYRGCSGSLAAVRNLAMQLTLAILLADQARLAKNETKNHVGAV